MEVTRTLLSPPVTAGHEPAVTVRLFAGAAEVAGARVLSLPIGDALTIREAFTKVVEAFPALAPLEGRLLFAANAEYAGYEFVLHAGDELSLIPPVSGGAQL